MEGGFEDLQGGDEMRAEYERRLQEAMDAAQQKFEREAARREAAARAEGERVAGLSAEERLRERETSLAGREKELGRRELRASAAQALAGRGLPGDLADALSYDSEEACQRSMESVERAFRSAVLMGVSQRLDGDRPFKGAEIGDPGKLSDDQYYAAYLGRGM